jgi:hypothetical protein
MKLALLTLSLLAAPGLAHAGGLLDTTGAEKDLRDAQKKVKGGVDTETDKHSVKIGDDGKGKSGKKAGKKKKPAADAPAK